MGRIHLIEKYNQRTMLGIRSSHSAISSIPVPCVPSRETPVRSLITIHFWVYACILQILSSCHLLTVCIVSSWLSSILFCEDRRHGKICTLNLVLTINKLDAMIEVDHQCIRIYLPENGGGRRSQGPGT